jgi:hypothetical protein
MVRKADACSMTHITGGSIWIIAAAEAPTAIAGDAITR